METESDADRPRISIAGTLSVSGDSAPQRSPHSREVAQPRPDRRNRNSGAKSSIGSQQERLPYSNVRREKRRPFALLPFLDPLGDLFDCHLLSSFGLKTAL